MNKAQDIHNYKRTLERLVERIKDTEGFSIENKKIALGFRDELLVQNISIAKTCRYLQHVIWLNRQFLGKNFEVANKADIKKLIADMNESTLSEHTKKGSEVFREVVSI